MHNCDDTDTAFSTRAELQATLENENITVSGEELKVGVEPDRERKALLTAFFNTLRSIETAVPDHKHQFKIELASFTVYYTKTDTPIFRLDRGKLAPVFDNDTIAAMATTVAAIQEQAS